jgi:hypothetical protein
MPRVTALMKRAVVVVEAVMARSMSQSEGD